MERRQVVIQLVTCASILLLVIIGQEITSVEAEPANEVRSVPVFVQSRPVYSKPSPKPKLILKPVAIVESENAPDPNPNRVTQTVYGFADFVTTIGNTVMVFTPKTKKAVVTVEPTSVVSVSHSETSAVVKATRVAELEAVAVEKTTNRHPKVLAVDGLTAVTVESSESEPHFFSTSSFPGPPPSSSAATTYLDAEPLPDIRPTSETRETINKPEPSIPSSSKFIVTPQVQVSSTVQTRENESPVATTTPTKGFTLKFSKTVAGTPKIVLAEKVVPKVAELPDEPTGIVSELFETKLENGVTAVHHTKIIGTYIGSQYARIFESSSSVVSQIVSTQAPTLTPTPQTTLFEEKKQKIPTEKTQTEKTPPLKLKAEVHTEQSVISSSKDEFLDDQQEFFENSNEEQYNEDVQDVEDKAMVLESSIGAVEPTPTGSEEQTLYILPQKETKAEIYISPVPNANAYSRQPQLFVDISPAKSVDFIVTATPSRGKAFRQQNSNSRHEYLNRFSQRFKNQDPASTSTSTESNELNERSHNLEAAASSEDSVTSGRGGRGGGSRFRSRGRSVGGGRGQPQQEDVLPTVSVYSNVVSASPTRRFNSNSRTRTKEVTFKTGTASSRGFGAATRQIQPTSSTSIYRFKLNRPTGRWRFKPSPKPKVNIIKTQEEELQGAEGGVTTGKESTAPVYLQTLDTADINTGVEETRTESNELGQDATEPELVPQTIRVATITPSEFSDLDKFLEVATIRSPYVFQAGNVKNTRYITLTKTFTKELIEPTQSSAVADATFENLLATKPPYEKILEGSSDVATLPLIVLGADMATPPLETITQTFSTTQIMLKTSILPVLYDGVTTLYTLTQSYFVTRIVTAHKTVPPIELFQFAPSKSLTEFNTALQEAGSEHREQLLGSESENDENDANYEHILAPPDELTSLGADFDPSSMDDKYPKQDSSKPRGGAARPKDQSSQPPQQQQQQPQLQAQQLPQFPQNGLPAEIAGLSSEQLAFLRYLNLKQQAAAGAPNYFQQQLLPVPSQVQYQVTSSPVVVDTITTLVETKTLRILFGAKPTQTTLYSTRVVPTKITTYVTGSIPVQPTAGIPNFFNPGAQFNPLAAYVG